MKIVIAIPTAGRVPMGFAYSLASLTSMPFYEKAWKSGFTVYLDHDASKMLSHVGQNIWNWREYA